MRALFVACLLASAVAAPAARMRHAEAPSCRWLLPQSESVSIEVAELSPAQVADIRQRLDAAGRTESRWTMLAFTVEVDSEADAPFRWSPPATSFVIVDARGERYGNVIANGRLEILPRDLREALGACEVLPGQTFRGLLLFRPTLSVDNIARVVLRAGDRTTALAAAR